MAGCERKTRRDVYEDVTNAIIAAIERGAGRYGMPWHHDGASASRPVNAVSGKPYRGANTLLLWAAAETAGYGSGRWATYRGWASNGAQVRKGEKAATVIFWKTFRGDDGDSDEAANNDLSDHRPRFMARSYSVFNAAQVDGDAPPAFTPLAEAERHAGANSFFANLNIKLISGGSEALYLPSTDTIHMPAFASFRDWQGHASVLFHEAAHASGAKHRLDRDLSGRFGTWAYAAEELVAEFSAAFVLADLGIAHEPRSDHAAYLSGWLELLKSDPRALVTAASKAQAAADWMQAQQPENSAIEFRQAS